MGTLEVRILGRRLLLRFWRERTVVWFRLGVNVIEIFRIVGVWV